MKHRKPDILLVLAIVLGLGITLSSLTQGEDEARQGERNAKASSVLVNTSSRSSSLY